MAKIDTFVNDMILAALLRDFYSNDILYLGRDADMNKLANACGKFSPDYEAVCKKFITYTTLQYALNVPYNQSDVQKLKFLANQVKKLDEFFDSKHDDPTEKMQFDAVEMAERLYRYGRMTYSDEDWALLYAFLNSPVSDKMYKKKENEKKDCRLFGNCRQNLRKSRRQVPCLPSWNSCRIRFRQPRKLWRRGMCCTTVITPSPPIPSRMARSSIPRRLANTATNTLCPPRAKTFCA